MAQDNLGALGWRLTASEELALDTAAVSISKGMVQNIFQTAWPSLRQMFRIVEDFVIEFP